METQEEEFEPPVRFPVQRFSRARSNATGTSAKLQEPITTRLLALRFWLLSVRFDPSSSTIPAHILGFSQFSESYWKKPDLSSRVGGLWDSSTSSFCLSSDVPIS